MKHLFSLIPPLVVIFVSPDPNGKSCQKASRALFQKEAGQVFGGLGVEGISILFFAVHISQRAATLLWYLTDE